MSCEHRARLTRRTCTVSYHENSAVSGQLLIKFKDPNKWQNPDDRDRKIKEIAKESLPSESIGASDLILVQAPEQTSLDSLVERFTSDPEIQFAEPDYVLPLKGCSSPPSPLVAEEWWLKQIDACSPPASQIETVVAVIDSGISCNIQGTQLKCNPDLDGNVWLPPSTFKVKINGAWVKPPNGAFGFDASLPDGTENEKKWFPTDTNGHGTSVAGIIAGNGHVRVLGVNPTSKIMVLKYQEGITSVSSIARAIDFIIQAIPQVPALRIVNCSFGLNLKQLQHLPGVRGTQAPQALKNAFDRLRNTNLLIVAAMDDKPPEPASDPLYPAAYGYDNLIAVTATDKNDVATAACDHTLKYLLGAPGKDIVTTQIAGPGYGGGHKGTSFAAPLVAGAASLILSKPGCEKTDAKALRSTLLSNADSVSGLNSLIMGGKRLNVFNALTHCHN